MDTITFPSEKNHQNRCENVYNFEDVIGEGTFSDVVWGRHNQTQKKFAVKIIDKEKLQTDKQKWRVRNEILLHKKCKHPNIVNFIEHYESDIDICLVLELCSGGELFNRIVEKGRFSEESTARTISQIASAIQYLHNMGIVHRDIKPENLLYTSAEDDAEIKLADFGLAKEVKSGGRATLKASLSGTTAYCAPERLNRDNSSPESKAVDIWSLGCICYFLIFGVPPFYSEKEDESENEDEIVESVISGEINFPANIVISDTAKDLILRLLEKDPVKRITVEDILIHPWIRSFRTKPDGASSPEMPHMKNTGTVDQRALLKSSINKIISVVKEQDTN